MHLSVALLPCYENVGSALGDKKQPHAGLGRLESLNLLEEMNMDLGELGRYRLCWSRSPELTGVGRGYWSSERESRQ